MKPKYKIYQCKTNSSTWYEVEKRFLWFFYTTEDEVKFSIPFLMVPYIVYGPIRFESYEQAKEYVSDKLPQPKQENGGLNVTRHLYERIF